MDQKVKTFILFLVFCMGARLFLVYLAKILPDEQLKIMGMLSFIPAAGFALVYLTKVRNTGKSVSGGPIWWNNLRPIHSFLYFLFSVSAISGNRNSWMILLADVIFGLINFSINYY